MYGDQFRSPGRDDRQDGPDPQRAPWETGPAASAGDDVKVAGAPNPVPPGFYDAGVYETTAYDQPDPYETTAYDQPGAPEGGAAAGHGMGGAPYDTAAPYEAGDPYEAGATSAMPPYGGGDLPPMDADFEGMRRKPNTTNKRLIRFAAVAAAVAVVGGGGVAWAVTGGSSDSKAAAGADAGVQAQAKIPAPAPLTDAQRKDAADKRRKELTKRASRAARNQDLRVRLVAKGTPPPTKKPSTAPAGGAGDPVPSGTAQQIARSLLPSYGWSPSSQFGCLVNLWNRESGWNTHAANPSGAYGIPQAKPGSKMASAGPDWQNNATTQIKWGLGYIKDRYSTPCGAWAHSQSTGWY
ncbi:lytic transglycosylase domain-containing protein [Actinomadura sp. DC4]|uniref:aggregation-promoting factor C-terminal-like domain-containing protein n=1 Tax=Actinomadura sp. DC4 TaxID=3055069 RepID=UPI0025B180FD|nr:lytic transglycosylase domain-containing protein [Actinomadura sp. DC4]MDN3352586.1 lytic transglycosylase domain-containing protein [Actinomadura sp. DC4]